MAIYTPTLGEMRGSVGSLCFSRNKGGPYVRLKGIPTNPNTERQQVTRAQMSSAASAWNNVLDDTQRGQWNEFAETHSTTNRLGQEIFITGLAWFAKTFTRLTDAGRSTLTEPGDLLVPTSLLTAVLTISTASTISIAFTDVIDSGAHVVCWGSGPLTAGADPNFKQSRLIGYSAVEQATPATFTLPWTLADGQYLKVFVTVMSAGGRCAPPLSDKAQYTA